MGESDVEVLKWVIKWQIPVFDGKATSWRRFEMGFLMAMRQLCRDYVLSGDNEEDTCRGQNDLTRRLERTLRQFEGSETFCYLESDFKLAEERC